jgi:hypothetical protein
MKPPVLSRVFVAETAKLQRKEQRVISGCRNWMFITMYVTSFVCLILFDILLGAGFTLAHHTAQRALEPTVSMSSFDKEWKEHGIQRARLDAANLKTAGIACGLIGAGLFLCIWVDPEIVRIHYEQVKHIRMWSLPCIRSVLILMVLYPITMYALSFVRVF